MLLELIFTACLISTPTSCIEEKVLIEPMPMALTTGEHGNRPVYGDVSESCDRIAMFGLADFLATHPNYKVRKWTCGPAQGEPV